MKLSLLAEVNGTVDTPFPRRNIQQLSGIEGEPDFPVWLRHTQFTCILSRTPDTPGQWVTEEHHCHCWWGATVLKRDCEWKGLYLLKWIDY